MLFIPVHSTHWLLQEGMVFTWYSMNTGRSFLVLWEVDFTWSLSVNLHQRAANASESESDTAGIHEQNILKDFHGCCKKGGYNSSLLELVCFQFHTDERLWPHINGHLENELHALSHWFILRPFCNLGSLKQRFETFMWFYPSGLLEWGHECELWQACGLDMYIKG